MSKTPTAIEEIPEEEPIEDIEDLKTEEETTPTEFTKVEKSKKGFAAKVNWRDNFNVKESTNIETVDRLTIVAGVNEYKGQHLIFLAKVTDKNFSRQFFGMPATLWQQAIPAIQKYIPKLAEIEKKSMVESVQKELQRLAELGIDISSLVKKVQ